MGADSFPLVHLLLGFTYASTLPHLKGVWTANRLAPGPCRPSAPHWP